MHRAKLKDGRDVAVKVQYPGVAGTVDQDLKNLKILLKTLGSIARDVMRQKVDVNTIYGELEVRLKEELDYYLEARNMTEYGKFFADDPDIIVPQVIKELSSRRVLTMTFIDGYPLMDVLGRRGGRGVAALGRAQMFRIRVAPGPRIRLAAHRFSSRQLSRHLSSKTRSAGFWIGPAFFRAGAKRLSAGRESDHR